MLWMLLAATLIPVGLVVALIAAPRGGAPASVQVEGDRLVVRVRGMYRLAALRSTIEAPVENVTAVWVEVDARRLPRGFRVGTYVPGGTIAGTFTGKGQKAFWALEHKRAVVIDLWNEKFTRLVLEVAEPEAVAAAIRARISTSGAVELGREYPQTLDTHCGVKATTFDAREWVAVTELSDGQSNPPPGWGNPTEEGTIVLEARDRAVFTSRDGERAATFRPRTPDDPPLPQCF